MLVMRGGRIWLSFHEWMSTEVAMSDRNFDRCWCQRQSVYVCVSMCICVFEFVFFRLSSLRVFSFQFRLI